ncbi:sporulation and spore germination protein [Mumia flava]|uniref:Sporulation and spore germination protein n=1 Tax=Mumia flava TaxID=1348852 RepID=A0A0B2BN13_9ACTN|nr:LpqB family beta-propeller domain-containing protein [Mumia flava]PJJ58541.1 sporulation and spore germination protein [Mumia flava]
MIARRWVVLLVLLGSVLCGCVSIPDSGPVRTDEAGRPQQPAPARIRPAGPADGASPRDIVNGYLQAMMASPVRYDIARRFLTADAGADWNPRASVTVYSQSSVSEPEVSGPEQDVALDLVREAVLTSQGRYAVPGQRDQHLELRLVSEDDQWRIANPPSGIFVTSSFFESYYDLVSAYFFNPTGQQLVAEPVHLPDDENRATYLMESLLAGPAGLVGGQARTFIPDTYTLARPVEIDGQGTAHVQLSGADSGIGTEAAERMSAQIVWTLRQVPGVTGVEILVGDQPIALPDMPDVQRVDSWNQFDPAAQLPAQLFAMREGRLVVVDRATVSPFAGPWGSEPHPVDDFRVSADASSIAVVSRTRTLVQVSPLSDEPELTTVTTGTDLLRPSWDAAGRLWVVDRSRGQTTITVGVPGERTRSVATGLLAEARVTGFELTGDGARVLATATADGGRRIVLVAAVRYDPETGAVLGLSDVRELPLPAGTGSPMSAAWRSPTSIAVLARAQDRAPQVSVISVDGSSSLTGAVRLGLLSQGNAVQVLCPGQLTDPLYVHGTDGLLRTQDTDGRWEPVAEEPVRVPSFAG